MAEQERPRRRSSETVEASWDRRQRERQAIHEKRKKIVQSPDPETRCMGWAGADVANSRASVGDGDCKLPDGAAPAVALFDHERDLHEAVGELQIQLKESRHDFRIGWLGYEKAIGRLIRGGYLDHPCVQEYLEGRRTFAEKAELNRYKNVVGRLPVGDHANLGHVDLWIAWTSTPMRERGDSVASIRRALLSRLSTEADRDALNEKQKLDALDEKTQQIFSMQTGVALDSDQGRVAHLRAHMKAISILWCADIRRRLGTDENLRQQLHTLGIDTTKTSKKTCPNDK